MNELAITTAIGIDKTDNGYLLSSEIINPAEIAGKNNSSRTEVIRYTTTGKTIFEAIRKLSEEVPRKVYMSHLRIVVFGEKMARSGIGKALDYLSRDHELRSDFYITVAKGTTADKVLSIITHQEKLPANKMFTALENSEETWAPTKTVTLDQLINDLVSKGKEPVLTGVFINGNPELGSDFKNVQRIVPNATLKIGPIGVFKKDKLIGWLNESQAKGLNYIIDNVKGTIVTVPCKGGKLSIETIRSKTKVTGKILNGKPKIYISVNSEGDVGDVECQFDLTKPKSITKLEQKYKDSIKKDIVSTVSTIQKKYHSDILGFGQVLYRKDYKNWRALETNWERQEFENTEVSVNVQAKIRRLGTINDSFQKEIVEKK